MAYRRSFYCCFSWSVQKPGVLFQLQWFLGPKELRAPWPVDAQSILAQPSGVVALMRAFSFDNFSSSLAWYLRDLLSACRFPFCQLCQILPHKAFDRHARSAFLPSEGFLSYYLVYEDLSTVFELYLPFSLFPHLSPFGSNLPWILRHMLHSGFEDFHISSTLP
jgi:hypothetical protein